MIIVPHTRPSSIASGTVYTVTWADGTDPAIVDRYTPMSGRPERTDSETRSWLMVGARLRRFRDYLAGRGVDPGLLECSPWTDLTDIADRFAAVFGFPGHVGFDPEALDRDSARISTVLGYEFGGPVSVVEADVHAGATVTVRPLAIGAGWIGLLARVSPTERVLAIPAKSVALVVANMLGSARRRTRTEALLVLADHAQAAYPTFTALLSQRKVSTGVPDLEARVRRLGELVELDAAFPAPNLFAFSEVAGKAAIAVSPEAVPVH